MSEDFSAEKTVKNEPAAVANGTALKETDRNHAV